MTGNVIFEGDNAIYFASRAVILDESMEKAWAEKHITSNPWNSWILGKYAEADRANSNRQRFQLGDLRANRKTLDHAPLNMNHVGPIVGTLVANELVYPTENEESNVQPFVEALSVMWKARYPDDYKVVETAHNSGTLFYSMECLPEKIQCAGELGCQATFDYKGRTHTSYCEHLNDFTHGSDKLLINPHFAGAALIVPPHQPGWNKATVTEISKLVEDSVAAAAAYEDAAHSFPELEANNTEALIAHLVAISRIAKRVS